MIIRFLHISILLSLSAAVFADNHANTWELGKSQAPLAKQGGVVLTQAEIDAAFSTIPPEDRLRFIRDGEKVQMLVRN